MDADILVILFFIIIGIYCFYDFFIILYKLINMYLEGDKQKIGILDAEKETD